MAATSNETKAVTRSIDALTRSVKELAQSIDALDARIRRVGTTLVEIENSLADYGVEEYADEDEL